MAMKFQYDEQGDSFVYFLLAFLILIFLPSTLFFWPRAENKENEQQGFKCSCDNCEQKRSKLRANQPRRKLRNNLIKAGLLLGWFVIAVMAYKVATGSREPVAEFDPYAILEIDRGATVEEIKKKYRQLSRVWHPDRHGGNETRFIALTKAHAALTDDTARENWEKYGNPDGPGLTTFGIALPSWLVQGKNSIWVLGLYGLVFMVLLPTFVGIWWYRSIRYTSEAVLIDTTKLFKYFFFRCSNMNFKRLVMILSGSYEFEKTYNPEVVQRPDDNVYVPQLLKMLDGAAQEKIKEQPFCAPYSVKARALLLAHFDRLELPARYLKEDLDYILKKGPMLVNEMVTTCSQIMAWHYSGQIPTMPSLETVENVMKLSQMLIQGLDEHESPLLQIPNIDSEMLRHFFVKKRNIKSVAQFLQFSPDERRKLLRSLTDKQYNDAINFCNNMPRIEVNAEVKVMDDDDQHMVTAGAIVTVDVKLKRVSLATWIESDAAKEKEVEEKEIPAAQETGKGMSKSAHRKNKKKGKGKKTQPVKAKKPLEASKDENNDSTAAGDSQKKPKLSDANDDESSVSDSESDDKENQEDSVDEATDGQSSGKDDDVASDKKSGDDEEEEDLLDLADNHEVIPEVKSKISHPVHCPYFPEEKQEWWWVFLVDRKKRRIITPPVMVTNLQTDREESLPLKFTAPHPGTYTYSVYVKSDSYLDCDSITHIKFDVKEAKEVDLANHPQYEMPDSDEENEKDSEDDHLASETDESDSDD